MYGSGCCRKQRNAAARSAHRAAAGAQRAAGGGARRARSRRRTLSRTLAPTRCNLLDASGFISTPLRSRPGRDLTCVKLSASSTAVSGCFVGSSFSLGAMVPKLACAQS